MKKYWQYASYIIRHKWFVFVAGGWFGLSLWRRLTHDLSKLLPSEWFPYMNYFYAKGDVRPFDIAWLKHQHRNAHHWQHWILREDNGNSCAMIIPDEYIREMVADWAGAGRAITGKWEVKEWYTANKDKMFLSPDTEEMIDILLTVKIP